MSRSVARGDSPIAPITSANAASMASVIPRPEHGAFSDQITRPLGVEDVARQALVSEKVISTPSWSA